MNNKTKLGLFLVLGILAVMISIIAVGSISLSDTYKVYASFDNVIGVTKKAKVKIAGVDIGVLRGIKLVDGKALLTLSINENTVLYKNAKVSIASAGIIGTKYIEIYPGSADFERVQNGEVLSVKESVSMEDSLNGLLAKVSASLDEFSSGAKDGNIISNLADAVKDLKLVMQNISSQNAKIVSAIKNINDFSSDLAQMTASSKQDLQGAMTNIKNASEKLDILITKLYEGDGMIATLIGNEEVGQEIRDTISDAKQTVTAAKTTVEGLSKTLGRAEKIRFQWDYLGRYNLKDEKFRNDLGISIIPNDKKFYYVGISNVADANKEPSSQERNIVNRLEALMGFNFGKFEIHGGIMRGTAGGGMGFSFFGPIYERYRLLQLNVDAYNFGRKRDGAEVNAGLRLGITKWLYAGVNVEDIAYKASVTPYIKIEIDDEDLAALLGIISIAAVSTK
jgi:phospholipid/cholesterol/gamma-HCH transport system substrate-binding protein